MDRSPHRHGGNPRPVSRRRLLLLSTSFHRSRSGESWGAGSSTRSVLSSESNRSTGQLTPARSTTTARTLAPPSRRVDIDDDPMEAPSLRAHLSNTGYSPVRCGLDRMESYHSFASFSTQAELDYLGSASVCSASSSVRTPPHMFRLSPARRALERQGSSSRYMACDVFRPDNPVAMTMLTEQLSTASLAASSIAASSLAASSHMTPPHMFRLTTQSSLRRMREQPPPQYHQQQQKKKQQEQQQQQEQASPRHNSFGSLRRFFSRNSAPTAPELNHQVSTGSLESCMSVYTTGTTGENNFFYNGNNDPVPQVPGFYEAAHDPSRILPAAPTWRPSTTHSFRPFRRASM
jgi:hypothetical protein